jgi:hypothetical protein
MKFNVMMYAVFSGFRIGSSGRLLETSCFINRGRAVYLSAERLTASLKGLCFMEL